ncbi:MAG: hypothetical protein FD167_774 [bacterium]|nr:MAG: hypothetical protein FD167_774 [bacterium]
MGSLTACNKTNPTSTSSNPSTTGTTANQATSNQSTTTPEKSAMQYYPQIFQCFQMLNLWISD